eukprot:scaffold184230_cov25-Tisochrysis_lutea.AAC.1
MRASHLQVCVRRACCKGAMRKRAQQLQVGPRVGREKGACIQQHRSDGCQQLPAFIPYLVAHMRIICKHAYGAVLCACGGGRGSASSSLPSSHTLLHTSTPPANIHNVCICVWARVQESSSRTTLRTHPCLDGSQNCKNCTQKVVPVLHTKKQSCVARKELSLYCTQIAGTLLLPASKWTSWPKNDDQLHKLRGARACVL